MKCVGQCKLLIWCEGKKKRKKKKGLDSSYWKNITPFKRFCKMYFYYITKPCLCRRLGQNWRGMTRINCCFNWNANPKMHGWEHSYYQTKSYAFTPTYWMSRMTEFLNYFPFQKDYRTNPWLLPYWLRTCVVCGWGKKKNNYFSSKLIIDMDANADAVKWCWHLNLTHMLRERSRVFKLEVPLLTSSPT